MFTIQAHGIPSIDTEWGLLSEAQNRLLTDPSPIRICGAPTGSGKTYAFIQVAKNRDKNDKKRTLILFVVPTQALAKDIEKSTQEAGITAYVWDGQQRESEKIEAKDLWIVRKEQLDHLKNIGGMLITTPETLQMIFFGMAKYQQIPLDISNLLDVDHIVFDEAHTLSARAFGFLHFWASLAVWWSEKKPEYQKLKMTWLSATHSTLFNAFFSQKEEGHSYISKEKVAFFDEKVVNEHRKDLRMLHGNVDVEIENGNIMDCVGQHAKSVLEKNERLLLLYDSLCQLTLDEMDLCRELKSLGVRPDEVFMINGQDRKAGDHSSGGSQFEAGLLPEEKHRVIIATSCIEAGVNIRNLRYAILDPGIDAAALLQRIGRVARGEMDGQVWITTPKTIPQHLLRLKEVSGIITIDKLSANLSPLREIPSAQARMLGSAYWSMLKRKPETRGFYKELVEFHHQKSEAKAPGGFLNSLWHQVESLTPDRDSSHYKKWLSAIDQALSDLRGFSPSVLIRFGDSKTIEYSYDWAKSYLEEPNEFSEVDGKEIWIYKGFRSDHLRNSPLKTNITLLCPNGESFLFQGYMRETSYELIKKFVEKIKQSAINKFEGKREFLENSAKFVESSGLFVRETTKDNAIF